MNPFKNGGQIFDYAFPQEFEDELKIPSIDMWSGMEGPFDAPDVTNEPSLKRSREEPYPPDGEEPFYKLLAGKEPSFPPTDLSEPPLDDFRLLVAGEEPFIESSGDGTSTPRPKKGPSTKSSKKWSTTTQKTITRLRDLSSSFDKLPRNLSPIEKYSTIRALKPLPPIEWKQEDHFNLVVDFPTPKYKLVQPPLTDARDMGVLILSVVMGIAGLMMFLFIIFKVMDKKIRTRKGVVLAVRAGAAEQNKQMNRKTLPESEDPSESDPQNYDLPPSYQECTLYSMNEFVRAVPLPYTNPEDHKERPDTFIEEEGRACSENVVPEMRMELVFENGRIVERITNKM